MPAAGWIRAALLVIGALSASIGAWALFAPRSFYDDFPGGGRGWVAAYPEYSEHLVRDFGGLFLGLSVVLLAAGILLEKRLVRVAVLGALLFDVPHLIFHVADHGALSDADYTANVLVLGATVVVLGAVLLATFARPREATAVRTSEAVTH